MPAQGNNLPCRQEAEDLKRRQNLSENLAQVQGNNNRRGPERRQADLGPPQGTAERRQRNERGGSGLASAPPDTSPRRRGERRQGERRKINLGPPPSTGERRFQPDPRGVEFIHIDCDE